jgi:hypothetical protein
VAHLPGRMQQETSLQCSCCTQTYHPNRALTDRLEAWLFGSEPYAVCPICEQTVPDGLRDESYSKRWQQAVTRQLQDDKIVRVAMLSVYLSEGKASDKAFSKVLRDAQNAFPDKAISELTAMGDDVVKYVAQLRKK